MAKKKKLEDDKYSADDLVIGEEPEDDADADEDLDEDDDDLDEDLDEDEDLDDADEDEDLEEDDDEEDDGEEDEHEGVAQAGSSEDPFWWTPHLVLASLLLIGLLGFFGMFNSTLGFLAARPGAAASASAAAGTVSDAPAPAQTQAKTVTVPTRPNRPQDTGEVYGAKHVLVMYKGSMRAPATIERTKEDAKKRADEAAKKATATKTATDREAAWKKLVEAYTDEPGGAQRAGDLGKFKPGSFHPQFVEGVKGIKPGEISAPVETPFGYHIIWRTE